VLYGEYDVSSYFMVDIFYAGDLFSLEIKARRGSSSSLVVADSVHQPTEFHGRVNEPVGETRGTNEVR